MSRDFPILMSPTSVRGLVRGLKTETRRLMSSPLAKLNVGDRLWVKETFVAPDYLKGTNPKHMSPSTWLIFPATHPSWNAYWTKTSSLFMPKHLSRLTLEITAIWREDLQDLTEIGARREGVAQYLDDTHCPNDHAHRHCPVTAYAAWWQSLHGADSAHSWDANPEVLVIQFAVHHTNIERLETAA